MLAAIWTDPDLAEVFFLVAVICLILEVVIRLARPSNWAYGDFLFVVGVCFIALGFLAL